MKKMRTLTTCLACLALLAGCQTEAHKPSSSAATASSSASQASSGQGVSSFEVGQTYVRDDGVYFKIVDEDTYVLFSDAASHYKSEQELIDASRDSEQVITPILYFYDCHYVKEGDSYVSDSDTETMMVFSTVANFKAGKYYRTSDEVREYEHPVEIKLGSQGYYLSSGPKPYDHYYKTDKQIPSSKEEFLDQYTYAPETQDDDRY